jgi:hypothetical protein
MDTVYIALVRWGPEWDGQSIYRTKSKALFEQIKSTGYEEPSFQDFNEELKSELRARHTQQLAEYPEVTSEEFNEEMALSEAMEWLDCFEGEYNKFPVILGGETELTCIWNW